MTRISPQTEEFKAEFFVDSVGRRRKLSNGAMQHICMEYAEGKTAKVLAREWAVSEGLIRSVVYHTVRTKDLAKVMDARFGSAPDKPTKQEPTKQEDQEHHAEAHTAAGN